jgi:hypothetical protein
MLLRVYFTPAFPLDGKKEGHSDGLIRASYLLGQSRQSLGRFCHRLVVHGIDAATW